MAIEKITNEIVNDAVYEDMRKLGDQKTATYYTDLVKDKVNEVIDGVDPTINTGILTLAYETNVRLSAEVPDYPLNTPIVITAIYDGNEELFTKRKGDLFVEVSTGKVIFQSKADTFAQDETLRVSYMFKK